MEKIPEYKPEGPETLVWDFESNKELDKICRRLKTLNRQMAAETYDGARSEIIRKKRIEDMHKEFKDLFSKNEEKLKIYLKPYSELSEGKVTKKKFEGRIWSMPFHSITDTEDGRLFVSDLIQNGGLKD